MLIGDIIFIVHFICIKLNVHISHHVSVVASRRLNVPTRPKEIAKKVHETKNR